MQNYVQAGSTVTLTAPYAVASGGGCLVGKIFGVAVTDVASGAPGEFTRQGVYDLPAAAADTPAQGAALYWDDAAKQLTTTAADNTRVGTALVAKAAGATTVRVLLDGYVA